MITRLGQLGTKLNEILEDHSQFIIHTGSFGGEKKAMDNPERYLWNIQNTFKYLEQARKENKTFIYISTWDNKVNPYTESKRTCERMVETWCKSFKVNYLIITIPSIIGKGIIHYFLDAEKELIIEDRELEFLPLDEIAEIVKSEIIKTERYINENIRIKGRKISVQLLYDLINYIKKYGT